MKSLIFRTILVLVFLGIIWAFGSAYLATKKINPVPKSEPLKVWPITNEDKG